MLIEKGTRCSIMVRLSSLQLSSNQSTSTTTGDGPTGPLPAQPRPSSERTACCSSSQTLHLQTCKPRQLLLPVSAADLYSQCNATSGCVGDNVVEPGDIRNMDVGVWILFLAVLCAEIVLLPVWAAAISISGITRLPVTSSTTTLNSLTSKTSV